jgi:hypothetical protein
VRIRITFIADDEIVDGGDETGLTADGYSALYDALTEFGSEIDIEREDQ